MTQLWTSSIAPASVRVPSSRMSQAVAWGWPSSRSAWKLWGGEIRLETRAGAGTTVRLFLPATIATFRGLLVQAGGQLFLLPIEAVERVIRITRADVEPIEGREIIRYHGHLLSVVWLSAL